MQSVTQHPAARVLDLGVRRQERLYLHLDHRLRHPPCPSPQHQQQRKIGDTRPWPHQTNSGILSPSRPVGPVSSGDRSRGLLAFDGVSFRVASNITEESPPRPSSDKFE